MTLDANIVSIFGQPPDGLDLTENKATHYSQGLLILTCVGVASVISRFTARLVQKAGFKADDYFIILALVRFCLFAT